MNLVDKKKLRIISIRNFFLLFLSNLENIYETHEISLLFKHTRYERTMTGCINVI